MKMKDLALGEGVALLLKMNGQIDATEGVSIHEGWRALAGSLGYSLDRTPAREAYEDGWFEGATARKKEKS